MHGIVKVSIDEIVNYKVVHTTDDSSSMLSQCSMASGIVQLYSRQHLSSYLNSTRWEHKTESQSSASRPRSHQSTRAACRDGASVGFGVDKTAKALAAKWTRVCGCAAEQGALRRPGNI
jgi:hypothetical protein